MILRLSSYWKLYKIIKLRESAQAYETLKATTRSREF